MFGGMESLATSSTETPSAGTRMQAIATEINRRYANFIELLSEADQDQQWLADGSPNVTQWLIAQFDISPRLGRRLNRIAKRLRDLPELRKRFAAGSLTLDSVDILSEVATPESEFDLLEEAEGRDLHDLARLASRRKSPTGEETAAESAADWLSTQWDLHRRKMKMAGELHGLDAQLVEDHLIEKAKQTPKNLETGSYDDWHKRMADALVETCGTTGDGKPSVPTIVVHADISLYNGTTTIGVAELSRGPVISPELAEMLGCDASVETAVWNDGQPIGIGRKSRSIPGWLRRQVEYRDHHCQAPGCGRTAFLQVHHLQPWVLGGPTELDNLILLCWWHHRFIHEHGWHITMDTKGDFVFRKADWTPIPNRSP